MNVRGCEGPRVRGFEEPSGAGHHFDQEVGERQQVPGTLGPSDPRTFGPSWLLWQLLDSAFPTGTFAHSYGLESAWQQGEVPDAAALARFVRAAVRQAGHGALPLVSAAHRDPARLAELDDLAD